jgi:hypothetical protein
MRSQSRPSKAVRNESEYSSLVAWVNDTHRPFNDPLVSNSGYSDATALKEVVQLLDQPNRSKIPLHLRGANTHYSGGIPNLRFRLVIRLGSSSDQRLASRRPAHGALASAWTFAFVHHWQLGLRERKVEILRRFEKIKWMNDRSAIRCKPLNSKVYRSQRLWEPKFVGWSQRAHGQ